MGFFRQANIGFYVFNMHFEFSFFPLEYEYSDFSIIGNKLLPLNTVSQILAEFKTPPGTPTLSLREKELLSFISQLPVRFRLSSMGPCHSMGGSRLWPAPAPSVVDT